MHRVFPHFFPPKKISMTFPWLSIISKDHFPWPRDITQQYTIFYMCIITSIRNIKFYQLQAIHLILTKVGWEQTSEMSFYEIVSKPDSQNSNISLRYCNFVFIKLNSSTPKIIILLLKKFTWPIGRILWLSRPGKFLFKFPDFPGCVWLGTLYAA